MKILFTGASSFTGFWFVRKLVERGHEVWATFTRNSADDYGTDVRGRRVLQLLDVCRPRFAFRFGDELFLKLLRDEKFALLCHHAADVTNYRSSDFDLKSAVANNTNRLGEVLQSLSANGGSLALTGTFFEPGEGAGSDGLPAFSPYGISKRQTADMFQSACDAAGVPMGKFVIPNPFGSWEDPRFVAYLMQTWVSRKVAIVRTPDYIRDNIHVSLLALSYVQFCEQLPASAGFMRANPSGYVESQGAFSERVAREMRNRTNWECQLEMGLQSEFAEPRERMNTDPAIRGLNWDESAAWDEIAEWYGGRRG